MSLSVTMSGMKVAQKDLDVIGNNIANAGTDGFKRSVTSFADVFPNDPSASPKTAVGQGAVVSLISRDTSQGSMSSTGKVTDMAITAHLGLLWVVQTSPMTQLRLVRFTLCSLRLHQARLPMSTPQTQNCSTPPLMANCSLLSCMPTMVCLPMRTKSPPHTPYQRMQT